MAFIRSHEAPKPKHAGLDMASPGRVDLVPFPQGGFRSREALCHGTAPAQPRTSSWARARLCWMMWFLQNVPWVWLW